MKKIGIAILAISLSAMLIVGCSKQNSSGSSSGGAKAEKYKIALATIHEGEIWEIQKKYFEEEVGPALNMEFMISEKLSDANGLVDFMERAYAAGCVGILSYVTANDAVAQGARRAEEWGMWFITQNSALNKEVADIPHNLGHCGASARGMGTAYGRAFNEILNDGKDHSLFIFSGAAVGGAIGQGAASHYYSVQGMLQAMQNRYGLTYDKSIDELINNQNPGRVNTGNPNVNIYIYPGLNPADATVAAQTQFQNGNYDIFAAVFSYSAFMNALSDVEKNQNRNIKVIGTASIEKQTATGFETKDSHGDTMLNAAVINPLNVQNGMAMAILYNAITGHADAMKDNGQAVLFNVEPWSCMNAETYEGISKLDKSADTYVINGADLKNLCIENNSSVTFRTIENRLEELADVNKIIAEKL